MVSTRSQTRGQTPSTPISQTKAKHRSNQKQSPTKRSAQQPKTHSITKKKPSTKTNPTQADNERLSKLLEAYGADPLESVDLEAPQEPTATTVLAHVLNALVSSARISHSIASKTLKTLIESGYNDIETLRKSSWEERTQVLTEGGYTRYREKTATMLGDLVALIDEKYDGNPAKLISIDEGSSHDSLRTVVAARLKEVKGIGDLGAELFLSTIQAIVPTLAPYIPSRDRKTAEELGLGADEDQIFRALNKDPVRMAKLCAALSTVRLEGKQNEL